VRLTPHFIRVHDLHPGILSIIVHSLLISWFTQVGKGILRKRTIAPPWAIVRRTLLQSAQPTEEANDRTSWGDRSLPRQAHVHPQPVPTPTLKSERSPPLGDRSPSRETISCDLFRSLFPFSPSLLQQCCT
jgi:hypothetical protein